MSAQEIGADSVGFFDLTESISPFDTWYEVKDNPDNAAWDIAWAWASSNVSFIQANQFLGDDDAYHGLTSDQQERVDDMIDDYYRDVSMIAWDIVEEVVVPNPHPRTPEIAIVENAYRHGAQAGLLLSQPEQQALSAAQDGTAHRMFRIYGE